ncbi:MAG: hypothetical protein ACYS9X_02715 [Planctomycetota bacterium]
MKSFSPPRPLKWTAWCGECREPFGQYRAAAGEEEKFPRARHWDVFAAGIPAPAIHFLDHPALAAFECPEGSHLDYRDATPFTRALARILKGVVDTGGPSPGD